MHSSYPTVNRTFLAGLCLLVFCSLFLLPKKANAQLGVPVSETNPIILETAGFNAGQNAAQTSQSLYEWAETLLTQTLKKQVLDFLVDQLIAYISGTDGGASTVIQNWEGFLGGAIGDAIADFGADFNIVDLCSPFDFQLKLIFSAPKVPTFNQRFKCTLNDIVNNIDDFRENFRNGSWLAYQTSFQPQNNFWGVYLEAESSLLSRANIKKETSLAEAVAGGGFLSAKKCDDNGENCRIVTPGRTIGDAVAKAVGSDIDFIVGIEAGDLSAYTAAIADAMFNRVLKEGLTELQGSGSNESNIASLGATSGKKRFEKEKKDTLTDIEKAIQLRAAAQLTIDRSGGNFDVASATHAKSALEYLHTEYQKIQRGDFVDATKDKPICQTTARGYSWVQNTVLGRIEKRIDRINTALAIVAEAVDDDPVNNPEFVPGADNNDNLDILAILQIAETDVSNLVIGDVVNGVTLTLSMAQDQLLTIRSSLPYDMILAARTFREGIKDLKEELNSLYDFVEDYNKGLETCIKNSSAAQPMSASTNPTNNWPW